MKQERTLDRTSNLIKLYQLMRGKNEVPDEYHFWNIISMIAAAAADRIYMLKDGRKLAPNLYILFVGDSGTGKSYSIDQSVDMCQNIPRINVYNGRTTAPALYDLIGTGPQTEPDGKRSKIWLTTSELSMSVGSGEQADTLIKFMTELYGSGNRVIQENTRTRGMITITNPCINWIAGSTIPWLKDAITQDAIEGGFFARVIPVRGVNDFSKSNRYWEPILPHDHKEVREYIVNRLTEITYLKGPFRLTKKAFRVGKEWYGNRPEPDHNMIPWWRRQHDYILKISMILSLADSNSRVIKEKHIQIAIKITSDIIAQMPNVIESVGAGGEAKPFHMVYEMIKRSGDIGRSALLRSVSPRGITSEKLDQLLNTLIDSQQVEERVTKRGGRVYKWMGNGHQPKPQPIRISLEQSDEVVR